MAWTGLGARSLLQTALLSKHSSAAVGESEALARLAATPRGTGRGHWLRATGFEGLALRNHTVWKSSLSFSYLIWGP